MGQTPRSAPKWGLPYMPAAPIGKRETGARTLLNESTGDVALQLLDVLALVFDDGFDQIANGQHAHDAP
jgi:hypothetical protein